MTTASSENRLIHESSPYLRQHAHNPVDWYPWGPEALDTARRENKPILLSIGYSACHWCHVMAHESFEDADTAAVMNELFINIKVDREERPDLDKIYQTAYQLLNGRPGGWPLTMFLMPDDHTPFFGATYVPKVARYGMPAFTDLLRRLMDFYQNREADVRQQNDSLRKALQAGPTRVAKTGYALNPQPLTEAVAQLAQSFDSSYGGFGRAPKFPHPTHLEHLLHQWQRTDNEQARDMALLTLRRMAEGGVYDHLGGGFCRYSVDEKWLIPHFEKMLYDNGPLLGLYAAAWRATGEPLFQQVTEETAAWALREMQDVQGGFYATLDADSEGVEGKFYVWDREDIRALLTAEEYEAFAPRYGLDRIANFEGHWHLHAARPLAESSTELVARARQKLFQARSQRIWPGRDEKILTSWNALMIKGLATAGRYLERPDWLAAAEQALDFIRAELWRDGRLLAVYKDGQARLPAYLDDYAFLLEAVLELLQGRWRDADLEFAQQLADTLLAHFEDKGKQGGFFFTADDHEPLIQRPKPLFDDALPSGNGVAALALLRLGHLLSHMPYLVAAERVLKTAWPSLEQNPAACGALLLALEGYYHPAETIILRGPADTLATWQTALNRTYTPLRLTLAIPADAHLPPFLAQKAGPGPVAYVCRGTRCSTPITDLAALEQALAESDPDQPA